MTVSRSFCRLCCVTHTDCSDLQTDWLDAVQKFLEDGAFFNEHMLLILGQVTLKKNMFLMEIAVRLCG